MSQSNREQRHAAKRHLKATGHSYRSAAPLLGVTYQHICLVLTGKRQSERLLAKIIALPISAKQSA